MAVSYFPSLVNQALLTANKPPDITGVLQIVKNIYVTLSNCFITI